MVDVAKLSDDEFMLAFEAALSGNEIPAVAQSGKVRQAKSRVSCDNQAQKNRMSRTHSMRPGSRDADVPWPAVVAALRGRGPDVEGSDDCDPNSTPMAWPDDWLRRGSDPLQVKACRSMWAEVFLAAAQDCLKAVLARDDRQFVTPSWLTSRDAVTVANLAGLDGEAIVSQLAFRCRTRVGAAAIYSGLVPAMARKRDGATKNA